MNNELIERIDFEKLRELVFNANRCIWGDTGEWTRVTKSQAEGAFIAQFSPDFVEELLDLVERLRAALAQQQEAEPVDACVAAIQYALETDDGLIFLSLWNEGEFDAIRKEWMDVPEAVFIGADPLHPETKHLQQQEAEPVLYWHKTSSDPREWEVVDPDCRCEDCLPLYLHPPKPAAQPQVPKMVISHELIQVSEGARTDEYCKAFADGWNACIKQTLEDAAKEDS